MAKVNLRFLRSLCTMLLVCVFAAILFCNKLVAVSHKKNDKQRFEKNIYQIKETTDKIKIDGVLNEEVWKDSQETLFIQLNYEILPGENIAPPAKTECWLTYDKSNLYVAFRAYDPQLKHLRAHLSDHDDIWNDDQVGIILDTFNAGNRAFAFFSNPLGIQQDFIYSDGGDTFDSSWDTIWDAVGRITDFGYVVEFKIPFSSLQFQRKRNKEQTWGFTIWRSYPRDQTYWLTFFPDDRNESCWLCKFQKLKGFKGVVPGKNIELDPTFTGIRTDERSDFPDGEMKKNDPDIDIGITGHWGFTSNLTLTAAINPDFSQVEADAAQLDINRQFALFYPEKRPLFLEGIDFFRTRLSAVYTRTIADPEWGVKLSGKEGKNTIGFFTAQDRITNLLFPGSESSNSTSMNQKAHSTVLRYRRDFGSYSTIGLLITDREGKNYHNRVAGIDGLIRVTKSDTIVFQFLGSDTLYPREIYDAFDQPDDNFSGSALNLSYQKKKRSYSWRVEYNDFTPGFRADLGFIPQVDFRKLELDGGYTYWGKPKHFFRIVKVSGELFQMEDRDRHLIERKAGIVLDITGPLQSSFVWQLGARRRVFKMVPFDQVFNNFTFSMKPSPTLNFNISLSIGDEIDIDNIQAGKKFYLRPAINFRLGKNIALSLTHSMHRLKVQGERLFLANITEAHLNYFFSKRAFFRGIIQYIDIERNPELYKDAVDKKHKTLFSQILFSYKLNPRTVLFLGYSDDYLGFSKIPLTQTNRTFFLKIGYALSI